MLSDDKHSDQVKGQIEQKEVIKVHIYNPSYKKKNNNLNLTTVPFHIQVEES